MATWAELEAAVPEIAAAGRRLLERFEVAYLATVSKAGWPRVHPFCPALARGRLWAFIMEESPKRRDLDDNGRFAIHMMPGDEDEEFYIAGSARRQPDTALRELALAAMPYDDADERHILYEFFPRHALWTTWENFQKPGMRPVHRSWHDQAATTP
jgi:uncharacterized pyridoxamine 5'-phosphate oxidase family protein